MAEIRESKARKGKLIPIMKALPQWVCWAHHRDPLLDEKPTINPNVYVSFRDEFASCDPFDEEIWMSYEEAKLLDSQYDSIDGVGFVVRNHNLCYIDIDNCVDPATLMIDDEVTEIIERFNSYTEISVSGTGIHIYCTGELDSYGWVQEDSPIQISAFDESWTVVTEEHVKGTPFRVKNCPKDLKALCEEYDFATYGGWKWG